MYVFTGSSMAGLAVSFGCMVFAMSFGTMVSTYILPRATTHTVPGWSLVLDWCMCLHATQLHTCSFYVSVVCSHQ